MKEAGRANRSKPVPPVTWNDFVTVTPSSVVPVKVTFGEAPALACKSTEYKAKTLPSLARNVIVSELEEAFAEGPMTASGAMVLTPLSVLVRMKPSSL